MTATRRLCCFALLAAWPLAALAASQLFTTQSYRQILARHAGRPMVLHFWSMTCEPCRTELTLLGQLHQRHPALPIVLVHIEPFPLAAQAGELRRRHLGNVEQWHVTEPFEEQLRYSVDPAWQGDIPRTLLIGAHGEVTRIQGAARDSEIESWLRSTRPD